MDEDIDVNRMDLTIDTFENLQKTRKLISNRCGVYIIYFKSGKIYIGSTSNVKRRIYQHLCSYRCDNIQSVSVIIMENIYDTLKLEYKLIKTFDPNILYNVIFVIGGIIKDKRLIDDDKVIDMSDRMFSQDPIKLELGGTGRYTWTR